MTEQVLAEPISQNQDTSSAPASSAPIVPHETIPAAEKMLSQKEVNDLVGRTKTEAYERGRRESVAPQAPVQNVSQPQSMGGMQQQSPDEINRLIDARLSQQSQANAANQFVSQFIQKMDTGKTKYPDFEQKVARLNLQNIPDIVQLASSADNTADVMYDLASNPENVVRLRELNQISPQLAFEHMQKLSASIKANEAAAQQKTANDPLSQVKTSTTGTGNGSLTVRDRRRDPSLRA